MSFCVTCNKNAIS